MVRLFKPYSSICRVGTAATRLKTCVAIVAAMLVAPAQQAIGQTASPPIVVHYMPWFVAKPYSETWGWHWTMNAGDSGPFNPDRVAKNGQLCIASHYYPEIGPYDSADPVVQEYHLQLMKIAGLSGLIADWYGKSDLNDFGVIRAAFHKLLPAAARYHLKVGVCYEDQTIPQRVKAGKLDASSRVAAAKEDLEWLKQALFAGAVCLRVADKPLLLSFGQTGLTDAEWKEMLAGESVAYYSEHNKRSAADGAFDWPQPSLGPASVDRFYKQHSAPGERFIATAFTRFDDVYAEGKAGASFPKVGDEKGELLRRTLKQALNSGADLVQIATWNDWGEGTGIEPTSQFGTRDLQTVQTASAIAQKAGWKPEDLSIPLRLYRLKRSNPAPTAAMQKLLIRIADGIAEANTSEVRSVLAEAEKLSVAAPHAAGQR
jgi:hypothetical protein